MLSIRRVSTIAIAPLLLALGISAAPAAVVSELVLLDLDATTSEVETGYANGFSETFEVLDPFDTSLGVLDRVEVSISGTVSHIVISTPIVIGDPIVGDIVFPYTMETETYLGFEGDTDYFSLFPDLSGSQQFENTGDIEALESSADFNLAFRIDAASESLGNDRLPDDVGYSTGLNGVPLVSGDRSDFLDSNIDSDLMLIVLDIDIFTPVGVASFIPSPFMRSTLSGTMQVDYHYTPIAPIPLPAALWLFATGLAVLGMVGRRRTANR